MEDAKVPSTITLAALTVRSNTLESKTEGVAYDPATGVVTFPNPLRLTIIPVVSDIASKKLDHYLTTTHYIREISSEKGTNQLKIWRTSLDNGDRNFPPTDFSVVIFGF